MPAFLAASMTSVPGAASICLSVDRQFYQISHFAIVEPDQHSRTCASACSYGHGLPSR